MSDEARTFTMPDGSKMKMSNPMTMSELMEFLSRGRKSHSEDEEPTPEWKEYDELMSRHRQAKKEFLARWDELWEKEKNDFKLRRQGAYEEWKRIHEEPEMPDHPPPLGRAGFKVTKEGRTCICGKCE